MGDEITSGTITYTKGAKKFNKKWGVLHSRSPTGVPRIELHDTKNTKAKNTISLDKCVKIQKSSPKDGKVFQLEVFFDDDKPQILSTTDEGELEKWASGISHVLFGGASDESSVFFDVEIKDTDMAKKFSLKGSYLLNVSAEDILLVDKKNRMTIIKWPLHLLRKYGRDKQEFSLEAGRRCPSGQGMFYFITDNYNAIFQEVEKNVKSIASRGRAQSTSSVGPPKPHPVLKAPHSPDMLIPVTPASSLYDDPLDVRREASASLVEDAYTYNEPINLQTASKSVKAKPGKAKPQKKENKTNILGKKKGAAKNSAPQKPPRQIPSAPQVEEAYQVFNGENDNLTSDYSSLDIGQEIEPNEYDSFHWTTNQKAEPTADSTYATAGDFPGSKNQETDVYDHVQR
uniref:Docking protein 5 n=1 Tax=Phallusia mammillata TaxID=59560 RepID=A0A6F9DAP7_9ASCI|nr:docking protein 5 [Phallusia mammillata]